MSTKEVKPELGGTRIRTRKRNIAVPLDHGSFADTVTELFNEEGAEGTSKQQQLESFVKVLETTDLDFNRYGDTLFEVLFTGGRVVAGGDKSATESKSRVDYNALSVGTEKEAIRPFVKQFSVILRRRPFLVKNLEAVLKQLVAQLEHFTEEQQQALAVVPCLIFTMKLGVPPENLMKELLQDELVAKGTMLRFVTSFFKASLSDAPVEDLIALLRKGRVEDLMLFFPMQKRTPEDFKKHFTQAGLPALVNYQERKLAEQGLNELKLKLQEHIEETPNGVSEAIEMVKEMEEEHEGSIPQNMLVETLWKAIMDTLQISGKNQQQASNAALRQLKLWSKLLGAYATTPRLQVELLITIQLWCYESQEVMKAFRDIIHLLYETDVLSEEAVLYWAKKGSAHKGRAMFLENAAPFIKWLEEAESEDDDE
jgi:hypothetical protein